MQQAILISLQLYVLLFLWQQDMKLYKMPSAIWDCVTLLLSTWADDWISWAFLWKKILVCLPDWHAVYLNVFPTSLVSNFHFLSILLTLVLQHELHRNSLLQKIIFISPYSEFLLFLCWARSTDPAKLFTHIAFTIFSADHRCVQQGWTADGIFCCCFGLKPSFSCEKIINGTFWLWPAHVQHKRN